MSLPAQPQTVDSVADVRSMYAKYGAVAYALALRMTNDSSVAEEIVQDAFVSLWRSAHCYRPERCSPRTWLLSIVRNRALDELRKPQRTIACDDLDIHLAGLPESEPWTALWTQHRFRTIRAAVGALPTDQRAVIDLAFFGGFSHVEIAVQIGAPLGTVKKRIRTGLRRLRLALGTLADAAAAAPIG